MTGEEMERAIEFLITHHAKVSSDIEGLKEAQKITTANIASLARQAETDRLEMRETLDKLILSNEVTRNLANQVASLAVATSQRVTIIEERLK